MARRTFSLERNLRSFRWDTRGSNERSSLGDVQRRGRPKTAGRAGPALRVGRVYSNPGPDAEDRLRRVITLMVKYATSERPYGREHKAYRESQDPRLSTLYDLARQWRPSRLHGARRRKGWYEVHGQVTAS